MKTFQELLTEAQSDYLHNASNLCGLAQSFAQVMKNLMHIADNENKSTEWVNTNKVTQLWVCKLSDLSGYEWLTTIKKADLFDN